VFSSPCFSPYLLSQVALVLVLNVISVVVLLFASGTFGLLKRVLLKKNLYLSKLNRKLLRRQQGRRQLGQPRGLLAIPHGFLG
jgi:hypothetical protein